MSAILDVKGREILDSRGNPTVEVDIRLSHDDCHQRRLPRRQQCRLASDRGRTGRISRLPGSLRLSNGGRKTLLGPTSRNGLSERLDPRLINRKREPDFAYSGR